MSRILTLKIQQKYCIKTLYLHTLPLNVSGCDSVESYLELDYCILLVQGRYSSVLTLKVFASTADSGATTPHKITLIVQLVLDCQILFFICLKIVKNLFSYTCFGLVTIKSCTTANLTVPLPRGLYIINVTLSITLCA